MRSLIWSEWRTKRLWGLPLLAVVVVPLLFGDQFTYWGGSVTKDYLSDALTPAVLIALLFGAMAFTGELGLGAQDFLLSRPVSWKWLLAAKLLVGFGMIAGAAVIGAVVFGVLCPDQYLPFWTAGKIAGGIGVAIALMGVPYLAGAACSVVLPGVVGSVLTMLAATIAFGVYFVVLGVLSEGYFFNGNPGMSVVPWMIGLALAAPLIVRFGLTLSLAQRARRYALTVLACVVCLTPVGFAVSGGADWRAREMREALASGPYTYSFSPDMSHMVVTVQKPAYLPNGDWLGTWTYDTYLQRLSDGRRVRVASGNSGVTWIDGSKVLVEMTVATGQRDDRGWIYDCLLMKEWMDPQGRLVTQTVNVGRMSPGIWEAVSPGGKVAVLDVYTYDKVENHTYLKQYAFLDLETMKTLDVRVDARNVSAYWWQGDSEFWYLDRDGGRHLVRVKGAEGRGQRAESRGPGRQSLDCMIVRGIHAPDGLSRASMPDAAKPV